MTQGKSGWFPVGFRASRPTAVLELAAPDALATCAIALRISRLDHEALAKGTRPSISGPSVAIGSIELRLIRGEIQIQLSMGLAPLLSRPTWDTYVDSIVLPHQNWPLIFANWSSPCSITSDSSPSLGKDTRSLHFKQSGSAKPRSRQTAGPAKIVTETNVRSKLSDTFD